MSEEPGQPSAVTVVIPTFNRLATLRLCLQHLEAQTIHTFDVILINDGSTDGTQAALPRIQKQSPLRLRVLHQQNAGPARARNVAIAQVTTDLCVLIGDDILPAPDFLAAHLRFHREHPDPRTIGLGWTQWDRVHQQVTPFMQWYEEIQFDYSRLTAGLAPTWHHFYTSNLSFKTSLLQSHPFDERFKAAAWEDIELGFRLAISHQLHLSFLPQAVATHVHPTNFLQAVTRSRTVGRGERLFHRIWPAARVPEPPDARTNIYNFLGSHPRLLQMLTDALGYALNRSKPGRLHTLFLRSHDRRGYLE